MNERNECVGKRKRRKRSLSLYLEIPGFFAPGFGFWKEEFHPTVTGYHLLVQYLTKHPSPETPDTRLPHRCVQRINITSSLKGLFYSGSVIVVVDTDPPARTGVILRKCEGEGLPVLLVYVFHMKNVY